MVNLPAHGRLDNPMINHIVLVKFRPEISAAERDSIWDELRALVPLVAGMESVVFGGNVSPEGLARGYADGFIMQFRDEKARDTYLELPEHKAAGARLVAAAEGGIDGLLVIDL